jgi:excisionase family DNA binding protein
MAAKPDGGGMKHALPGRPANVDVAALIAPRENLTPAQAAEFLGVPEATLSQWRSSNRVVLPFWKCGGRHVRYRRIDLERFIEQNMHNAAEMAAA